MLQGLHPSLGQASLYFSVRTPPHQLSVLGEVLLISSADCVVQIPVILNKVLVFFLTIHDYPFLELFYYPRQKLLSKEQLSNPSFW